MEIKGLPVQQANTKKQVEFSVEETDGKLHFIMDAATFAASVGPSSSGKDFGVSLAPAILNDANGTRYKFRVSWVGVKAL